MIHQMETVLKKGQDPEVKERGDCLLRRARRKMMEAGAGVEAKEEETEAEVKREETEAGVKREEIEAGVEKEEEKTEAEAEKDEKGARREQRRPKTRLRLLLLPRRSRSC